MSLLERLTKPKADAETQPAQESAPSTSAAPLRNVLIDKLREKAEQGDIAAIKLLLDSPELCEPEVPKTLEEAKANLIKFMQELADRSVEPANIEATRKHFLDYVKSWAGKFEDLEVVVDDRCLHVKPKSELKPAVEATPAAPVSPRAEWELAVERRLQIEESSELSLSAWKHMSSDEKLKLWAEMRVGLRSLGELLKECHVSTVQ